LARLRKVAPLLAGPDGTVAWHDLGHVRLSWIRDRLQSDGTTPLMINLTLIVLRGVARAGAELGFISEERADSLHLVRGLPVPHNRPALGQVLAPNVVVAVFAVCWQDRSIAGLRDLVLLHGIYWAGLSTAELASLRVDDYTPSPPLLQVHSARSARQRRVELVDESAVVFERWRAVRGSQPGVFFFDCDEAPADRHAHTAGGITQTVRHRAVSAGLAPLGPQIFAARRFTIFSNQASA